MIISKDILGHEHTIVRCVNGDIPLHFAKIKEVIPSNETLDFIERMEECVAIETAFKLPDDSCFLYYKNYKPDIANGVALYGKDAPIRMLALFTGVFSQIDKQTFKLDFQLHPGKFLDEYKSILTLSSMKRSHHSNRPLIVRIDKLKNKIHQIYANRDLL